MSLLARFCESLTHGREIITYETIIFAKKKWIKYLCMIGNSFSDIYKAFFLLNKYLR